MTPSRVHVALPTRRGSWAILSMALLVLIPRGASASFSQSYHPAWAPDGETLAYVVATERGSDIRVLQLGSGALQQLTSGAKDYYPAWSPDGRRIAFVSERDGNPELYVMDADGTRLRRLTHSPGSDVHPAWSNDGGYLAFDTDRHGPAEVYVLDVATGTERRITVNLGEDKFPIWAPHDSALIVSSDRTGTLRLHLIGLDGRHLTELTDTGGVDMDWKSTWSPDGRAIAFASARNRNFDLYLRKVGTGITIPLTDDPAVERYPVWSPRGDRIAFASNASGRLEVYYFDLTHWTTVQATGLGG